MLVIGIDCGLTGAIAAIDGAHEVAALHDLPVMVHGKTKWIDAETVIRLLRDARNGRPARAVIETTHAMPGMGSVASNLKGMTLGSTLAALQVSGIPFDFVSPAKWKAALNLSMPKASDSEKKAASLSLARQWFPGASLDRKKDHNRAEALLIAAYFRRHVWGAG